MKKKSLPNQNLNNSCRKKDINQIKGNSDIINNILNNNKENSNNKIENKSIKNQKKIKIILVSKKKIQIY